jgi:hypothetical protein
VKHVFRANSRRLWTKRNNHQLAPHWRWDAFGQNCRSHRPQNRQPIQCTFSAFLPERMPSIDHISVKSPKPHPPTSERFWDISRGVHRARRGGATTRAPQSPTWPTRFRPGLIGRTLAPTRLARAGGPMLRDTLHGENEGCPCPPRAKVRGVSVARGQGREAASVDLCASPTLSEKLPDLSYLCDLYDPRVVAVVWTQRCRTGGGDGRGPGFP